MPRIEDLEPATSVDGVDLFVISQGGVPKRVTGAIAFEDLISQAGEQIRSEITSQNVTDALGYTPAEDDLSNLSDQATARANLGATALGSQIFTAPDEATARTDLGLGSAALLTAGTGANNALKVGSDGKMPIIDGSNLTNITSSAGSILNGQTGAYTALATDAAKVIRFTGSGGVTMSVTAAATLGSTWYADIANASTGIITVDPNGSETVDGKTTILVYPGEQFRLHSDGTNLFTLGRRKRVLVQTASPTGVSSVAFETAFSDPEAVTVEFEFEGIAPTAGVSLFIQLKFNGSYLTTSASYLSFINGSGASQVGVVTNVGNASSTALAGLFRVLNMKSLLAYGPMVSGASFNNMYGGPFVGGPNTAQTTAVQGAQFKLGTNFTGGTIRCYLNRE